MASASEDTTATSEDPGNSGMRRTEEALRRSEELLRTLLETTPDHILTVDEQGLILYINRVAPELEGQDVIGQSCYEFMPAEAKPLLETALRIAFVDGEPSSYEVQTNFGRTYVSRVAPLRPGADGNKRALLVATDVTDQRKAEEEREHLEARVQETQRLESLALLAGGVAHDFNNLLLGILGRIEMALRHVEAGEPHHAHLTAAYTAAMSATELTNQLLALSGKGKFVVEPIDLNTLIQDMVSLFVASPTKKLELKLELADELPGVEGDATQLRQVIMNFVTNAVEAMENRPGGLILRTARVTSGEVRDARFPPEAIGDAPFLMIEVIDRGQGIDPALLNKVFDPFFSTKFKGRGLGLAAALGIARGHQGGIDVISSPGEGSTFRLLLPALQTPVSSPAKSADVGSTIEAIAGSGTVLIVEDEEHVRLVASILLEESGFTILSANDGAEALDVFLEHKDEIDVVLLDLLMPNMDGEQALEALRKIAPDVCVVLTSGYSEDVATSSLDRGKLAGFLKKPYKLDALVCIIRKAIASKSA